MQKFTTGLGSVRQIWPYLFLAPALLHLLIFRIGPMIYIGFLSLKSRGGVFPTLNNFRALLNPRFIEVLFNSAYYIFGGLILIIPTSFILALLLDKVRRGQGILRTIYFYPFTVVMTAVGIIWGYGFRPDGFVNALLGYIGLPALNWLGGTGIFAMPALIIATSWRYIGYFTIIFLSGLQAIPKYLYDAAKIDGAGPFQLLWHVTLPQLKPITLFVIVFSTIEFLRQFAIPKIMTKGGPFNKTNVLALEIYQRAFRYFEMGEAAAQSIILISLAIILSIILFIVTNRLKG